MELYHLIKVTKSVNRLDNFKHNTWFESLPWKNRYLIPRMKQGLKLCIKVVNRMS